MPLINEIDEVKRPEIRNRRDLHRFLEIAVNKTYELEKEYQRLEEDLNMVKSRGDENSHIRVSSTSQNLTIFVLFCQPFLNRRSISGVLNTACFTNIDS